MRRFVLIAFLGACTGTVSDHPTPYMQTLPSGPCAVEGVTGSVPGVTLAIRSASCVYPMGSAATFTYEVTTDATVPALSIPNGGGGCGSCAARTTDPMSWVGWTIGGTSAGGTSEQYCLCDVGCCPPDLAQTIQPAVATESATIEWSGRTWAGPSDTNSPMGDFFAPGVYAVVVGFAGYDRGSVQASLPIEIIP